MGRKQCQYRGPTIDWIQLLILIALARSWWTMKVNLVVTTSDLLTQFWSF